MFDLKLRSSTLLPEARLLTFVGSSIFIYKLKRLDLTAIEKYRENKKDKATLVGE